MSAIKQAKDYIVKLFWDGKSVPTELFDLSQYFRNYGPIEFECKKEGDRIIAVSKNFRYGSIITSARDLKELDDNIKDAILTSFEVPSSYAKEAALNKTNSENKVYAIA